MTSSPLYPSHPSEGFPHQMGSNTGNGPGHSVQTQIHGQRMRQTGTCISRRSAKTGHVHHLACATNLTRSSPRLRGSSECQGPATNTLLNLHIHVEKYLKLKSLKPTPPARFIPLPKELPPCCSTNKPISLSSRHPYLLFPEPPCEGLPRLPYVKQYLPILVLSLKSTCLPHQIDGSSMREGRGQFWACQYPQDISGV